jgi:hypothetical protein
MKFITKISYDFKLNINLSFYVFGFTPWTKFLAKASLTEKLIACVGKYLITLAKLPLQNASKPSSLPTLTKQFTIPIVSFEFIYNLFKIKKNNKKLVYCFPLSFVFAAWVYINNLTLSIGAATVLAIAPDIPPIIKSISTLLNPADSLLFGV